MSDSESAWLVRRERTATGMSYTEEGGAMLHDGPPEGGGGDVETDGIDCDVAVLSQFHEDALQQAGVGYFQWLVMLTAGLGLAADAIELSVVAFLLPSAEVEMCMDETRKTWLGAITFLGMMCGAVVWGNLSDRMGRRRILLTALSVNSVFSVVAAFMPTYGTFMTARFCSAVGVGGALPVLFPYVSEFLTKPNRGKYLSWLLCFWVMGSLYVALMAWAFIPKTGLSIVLEDKEHFSAWHQFLLLCSLPAIASLIGLILLPESPRYLLEAGREVEAMTIYQRIYRLNHTNGPTAQYQLSELELPSRKPGRGLTPPSPGKSVLIDMTYSLETFWNSFLQLFLAPHFRITAVLLILWFTASIGYHGLSVWLPGYMSQLRSTDYKDHTRRLFKMQYEGQLFNTSLENLHYLEAHFQDCRFTHLILNHVTFENCTFDNSDFVDVKSSRTFFKGSEISGSRFIDTDLYPYRFEQCELRNCTFLNLVGGCQQDVDYNQVAGDRLQLAVATLAALVGVLVASLAMERVGRGKVIGMSLFLSSVAAFFIWFLDSGGAVVAFQAVFCAVFIPGWTAIHVATTESYPSYLRTTAYGFLVSGCRLGGLLGSLTFAGFTGVSRAIPMLTTAAVLLIGGITSVKLPETRTLLL